MSADPSLPPQRGRDTEHRLTNDITFCSKLVRSSQATPAETAKAAPPKMET